MNFISNIHRLWMPLGLLAIVPGLAWPQIRLVHVTSCGPGAFPGTVCTIPSTTTGNLVVVGLQMNPGNTTTTISSVTDNAGNAYKEAGAARSIDATNGAMADLWYAKSVSAATSITITPSGSVTRGGAVIWEFSGVDGSAPLDQTAVLNSQAASATPSGAAVTTAAAEVVVSLADVSGNVTGINSGNPFINDSALMSNGWAHFITTSTGMDVAQWIQSPTGSYCSSTASFKAASGSGALNACDVNADGVVNIVDVQLVVSMDLGTSPCTADIEGVDVCNVAVVQRVIAAALGGTCVTSAPTSHDVALSWTASTSTNVAGYNVYRGTTSGGPYSKLNSSLLGTAYTDNAVQAGQTYYYVSTAVDSSNNESAHSNEAKAVVPSP